MRIAAALFDFSLGVYFPRHFIVNVFQLSSNNNNNNGNGNGKQQLRAI